MVTIRVTQPELVHDRNSVMRVIVTGLDADRVYAIHRRPETPPVAFTADRELARAIAGAIADTENSHPVVWEDAHE